MTLTGCCPRSKSWCWSMMASWARSALTLTAWPVWWETSSGHQEKPHLGIGRNRTTPPLRYSLRSYVNGLIGTTVAAESRPIPGFPGAGTVTAQSSKSSHVSGWAGGRPTTAARPRTRSRILANRPVPQFQTGAWEHTVAASTPARQSQWSSRCLDY